MVQLVVVFYTFKFALNIQCDVVLRFPFVYHRTLFETFMILLALKVVWFPHPKIFYHHHHLSLICVFFFSS